jgi:hypothetical protein
MVHWVQVLEKVLPPGQILAQTEARVVLRESVLLWMAEHEEWLDLEGAV